VGEGEEEEELSDRGEQNRGKRLLMEREDVGEQSADEMNQNKTEGFGPLGFIWGRDAGGGSPMGFSGWSPPNAVMYVPVVAWDVRHEYAKSHGEWRTGYPNYNDYYNDTI
jgi:hypothetical protein